MSRFSSDVSKTDVGRDNRSTDPRVLLRVAPTIMKQSFEACIAGVIDMPTLREGVTYFLQDLLSFTLPGILRWIVGEIGRSGYVPSIPS